MPIEGRINLSTESVKHFDRLLLWWTQLVSNATLKVISGSPFVEYIRIPLRKLCGKEWTLVDAQLGGACHFLDDRGVQLSSGQPHREDEGKIGSLLPGHAQVDPVER